MKLITFAVPSYNSEAYMRRCIDSLLPGGEDVEIIIVNDGSKDHTGEIAAEYEEKYPTICKAVQKENGGHGSGVNKGLELATGLYYKVVDSDDWYDAEEYLRVLEIIRKNVADGKVIDLYVSNYIYDHLDEGTSTTIRYTNIFPVEKICTWNDIHPFTTSQNLLMHTLIYRTELLRAVGLKLPEHTFYVDNLFAYIPLPYVETLEYVNADLYHYYIGREDQSVNEKVMCSRIDQQLKVTKLLIESADLNEVKKKYPVLARYMLQYANMMMMVSCIHLQLIGDEEAMAKKDALWEYVKESNPELYKIFRSHITLRAVDLPTEGGRKISIGLYRIAKKIFKFQ